MEVNALIYLALKQETQKILTFLVGCGRRTLLINQGISNRGILNQWISNLNPNPNVVIQT